MLDRCENPDRDSYHSYGGRGITVCDRWHDMRLFVTDIDQLLGPRPAGHSLDRIDNNGNYEPGNVRWATPPEQRYNSRACLPGNIIWSGTVHQADGEEHWLPVPGYQGWYEVSDAGNVYSLGRASARGGLLKPQPNTTGYRTVRLVKYGREKTRTVGSLVLLAFRGPPPPGCRARHGDGGRLDDSLGNLRWA